MTLCGITTCILLGTEFSLLAGFIIIFIAYLLALFLLIQLFHFFNKRKVKKFLKARYEQEAIGSLAFLIGSGIFIWGKINPSTSIQIQPASVLGNILGQQLNFWVLIGSIIVISTILITITKRNRR